MKWYKDGEKLQDTERVWLEQDGTRHSLAISAVEMSDAGEYLCDSGDDSLIFYVMVEGNVWGWGVGGRKGHLWTSSLYEEIILFIKQECQV